MPKIETEFIIPFIEATHTTFEMMMNHKLTRHEVYVKKNCVMFGDVTGFIGVSGKLCGTAAVSLPGNLAIECVGAMMNEKIPDGLADRAVHDGVGEIINMIAGQAKTSLGNTPYRFNITLPTIISGRGHELYHTQGTTSVSVIFATESGDELAIDISTLDSG